jgi:hypothetical protein
VATALTVNQLIQSEQYLLNQFCQNLRAVIHRLIEKDDALQEPLNRLDSELDTGFSWATANRVELALVDYYDGVTLLTEWRRRQADVVSLPSHYLYFIKSSSKKRM